MREEYLHYIWKNRRFRSSNLKLTDGQQLEITNVGWHNHDAGPDFFNGTVKIDGLSWTGNIEIHIRSSDWYKHQHHLDRAYDNVILHVVLEHDKEVSVEGRKLPTLTIADCIDQSHLNSFNYLVSAQNVKPCSDFLAHHKSELIEQVEISFFHRLERKGLLLKNEIQERKLTEKESLLYSIAKALGGRLNKEPMQELFSRLPFKALYREGWDTERIDSLVFGTAGLLDDSIEHPYVHRLFEMWSFLQRKYDIQPMKKSSWKFKGVRPHSFPGRRLAELASLIKNILNLSLDLNSEDGLLNIKKMMDDVILEEFWATHFTFEKESNRRMNTKGLSKQAEMNIWINAIAPYLIYRKHHFGEYGNQDLIIELLTDLKAESNKVTQHWESLGVDVKNAMESQGLLELNNEFCIFRKCLNCRIGNSILES